MELQDSNMGRRLRSKAWLEMQQKVQTRRPETTAPNLDFQLLGGHYYWAMTHTLQLLQQAKEASRECDRNM